MDLLNNTGMQAGYTMGIKPSGRELLVMAVKGTFTIPARGEIAQLAEEQVPLIEADTFSGEPGYSAPVYEVDYAPIKHRCDVILNGSAYAPDGRPVKKISVGLRVAGMAKKFDVVGDRAWQMSKLGYAITPTAAFLTKPISYDCAFGGSDNQHPDESKHSAHMLNPVGRGYHVTLIENQ